MTACLKQLVFHYRKTLTNLQTSGSSLRYGCEHAAGVTGGMRAQSTNHGGGMQRTQIWCDLVISVEF